VAASDLSDRLQSERSQLDYFVQNMAPTALVVPTMIAGVAAVLSFWSGILPAIVWAVVVIGTYVAFYTVTKRGRAHDMTDEAFQRWRKRVVIGNLLGEITWVSATFIFWQTGDVLNNAFLLCILAAHLAMAIGHSSIYLPLMYGSILVPAFGLVLMPISTGDPLFMAIGGVAGIYVYFLVVIGKGINRTSTAMLALRDEKDALIQRLKTEKRVAEHERSRAEEANQTKSTFLASISHELRTPLNAIIGFSDVMRAETFGPVGHDNYRQYVDDIHGSGQHLLSLINDVLDLARIEAGRLELNEEPVDLGGIAEDCKRMIGLQASERNVTIELDMPAQPPRILADARAMRQLWLNLVSNAFKFTGNGGRVTLFAGTTADGSIRFGVEDTGCGMDEDELARVMNAFTQGNAQSHTGERGTGLGLAIVTGLVDAHGGTFGLESTPGVGTRATVTLPRARLIHAELSPARVRA